MPLQNCMLMLFLILNFVTVTDSARAQTAAGFWEQSDSPGSKVNAIVKIVEDNGVFSGSLSTLYPDPGDDPAPRCDKCSGSNKGKPLLGLTFIQDMNRNGLKYAGGTILDPETGSVYDATMELSADGRQLTVRGFLGFSIFGQSQTWNRAH